MFDFPADRFKTAPPAMIWRNPGVLDPQPSNPFSKLVSDTCLCCFRLHRRGTIDYPPRRPHRCSSQPIGSAQTGEGFQSVGSENPPTPPFFFGAFLTFLAFWQVFFIAFFAITPASSAIKQRQIALETTQQPQDFAWTLQCVCRGRRLRGH